MQETNQRGSVQRARGRRHTFVGRESELAHYNSNLLLPCSQRTFVFSISGIAGVGKSTLLEKFRDAARNHGALTAWTDDTQRDFPSVLASLAIQLSQHDNTDFSPLIEQCQLYRARMRELQLEPEAKRIFGSLENAFTRRGFQLIQEISSPHAGVRDTYSQPTDEALPTNMSGWIEEIFRRQLDKDEIRLLQDPKGVLTPLFLEALWKVTSDFEVALFFDAYETTGVYLDSWLRDLLHRPARYGELPDRIVISLAGQSPLGGDIWGEYEDVIQRMPLEPFSVEETRAYFALHRIVEPNLVNKLVQLSSGLPLFVEMLSATPANAPKVADPSVTAVSHFLKSESDPLKRKAALQCAVPRRLNQDIVRFVAALDSPSIFDWLIDQSFVQVTLDDTNVAHAYAYHPVVREHMLRFLRRNSIQIWQQLHQDLASYYGELCGPAPIGEDRELWTDPALQADALELAYHHLCISRQAGLGSALSGFLRATEVSRDFALRWAGAIRQCGEDLQNDEIRLWGENLAEGLSAIKAHRFGEAMAVFADLSKHPKIEDEASSIAFAFKSALFFMQEHIELAIDEVQRAISRAPDRDEYQYLRIYYLMCAGHYEAAERALSDLGSDNDIELTRMRLVMCIILFMAMEKFQAALDAIDELAKADDQASEVAVWRSRALIGMGRYDEAAAEINAVLSELASRVLPLESGESLFDLAVNMESGPLEKFDVTSLVRRVRDELGTDDEAADAPQSVLSFVWQQTDAREKLFAHTSLTMADAGVLADKINLPPNLLSVPMEKLLESATERITADPTDTRALLVRARARVTVPDLNGALSDLDLLVARDPLNAEAFALRAGIRSQEGEFEQALADYDQAFALNEDYVSVLEPQKGAALKSVGRLEEALQCFRHALKRESNDPSLLYNVATLTVLVSGPSAAKDEISRARRSLLSMSRTNRPISLGPSGFTLPFVLAGENAKGYAYYGLGGIDAVLDKSDSALAYLQRALAHNKETAKLAKYDPVWTSLRNNEVFIEVLGLTK